MYSSVGLLGLAMETGGIINPLPRFWALLLPDLQRTPASRALLLAAIPARSPGTSSPAGPLERPLLPIKGGKGSSLRAIELLLEASLSIPCQGGRTPVA